MAQFKSGEKGFTLAEVLVTLTIVGVIAALTIPGLLQNIQNAQYKTAWKKAYSDLSQAYNMILSENGGNVKGISPYAEGTSEGHDFWNNLFLRHLNYIKSCPSGTVGGNCLSDTYHYIDGSPFPSPPWPDAGAALADGAAYSIFLQSNNCDIDGSYSTTYGVCASMNVDVNGLKTPNIVGKDVFIIWITPTGLKPAGNPGDTYSKSDLTSYGYGYSAKYLMQ